MRLRSTAFAAVVAAALTAGPAVAKDLCVAAGGGCSTSVQQAVDAAAANPGHDRILVGPGVWAGTVTVIGDVEIDGSGPSTVLTGTPALRATARDGNVTVRRIQFAGNGGSVVSAESGALTIRDSLIDARAAGGPGVTTTAGTVDLESVTLLGAGRQAIDAHAAAATDHVAVSVRDSVISGFGAQALARTGAGVADMSLDYVDVFPRSDVVQHAAGTLMSGALIDADPGFAADGITPAPGSPLIDAATPGAFGAGELDLLGNRRLLGFGCARVRRDIGAVEAVGPCPTRRHRWLRHGYIRLTPL